MQLLLLFMASMLPANWLYHALIVGLPATRGIDVLFAADMATALSAGVAFALVRCGKFHLAITLFLSMLLLGMAASALAVGFQLLMFDQTHILLSLVVGGLVLGRQALWTIFSTLQVVFGIGMAVDAHRLAVTGKPIAIAFGNAPSVVLSYLVITVVIDRCVHALLKALKESKTRGEQLVAEIAERERAQSQLFHAQKMEAVGRVAGGIAHDFDNILSVILGYAAARERLAGAGTRALLEALEGIEQATRRAMTVSRRLLTFSRDDRGQPEHFDADLVLREFAPMLQQLCGARVRVELQHAPDVALPVLMDRSRFELMLLNLAANARDAMPSGGRLRISTDSDATNGYAVLTLTDTGMGMEPQIRQHIFEPFYTTKPVHQGTGLGLDVVSRVMDDCGGVIEVDSAPGRGTRFTLKVPLQRRAGN
ncbi:Histidine kinase-, DNA gyrase B-, and HSP90-like ATPase [Dyella sp. OK004]|uniref:sensor histidine kinase n=1 Tax=Dyella sp. OK004 TaxID=1855292 RepID=UPI0008ED43BD|nr:ATP-binding protein [Dyella sp. OK004]SFS14544.1 Histidine kinase-, DNA gyrase B-, and HSP90-like ATPase [Dyella sp. OK004]